MRLNLSDHPHRRLNPLTGDWVMVSPHRMKRPWQGRQEPPPQEQRPAHDPQCYLCPGNERAGGERNPTYESTYVFDNDFAALLPESPSAAAVVALLPMTTQPERAAASTSASVPISTLSSPPTNVGPASVPRAMFPLPVSTNRSVWLPTAVLASPSVMPSADR